MKYKSFIKRPNHIERLSEEELNRYIFEFKKGNYQYRNTIINSYVALVKSRVKTRFNEVPFDKEDLISVGFIGLLRALDMFKIEKNVKFITYATRCIDVEIIQYIKAESKNLNVDSLEKNILFTEDSVNKIALDVTFKDTISDCNSNVEDNYEKKELAMEVRRIINTLSPNEKKMVCMYFGIDTDRMYKQKEIADILDVSQTYISSEITKSLTKIKTKFINIEKQENRKLK